MYSIAEQSSNIDILALTISDIEQPSLYSVTADNRTARLFAAIPPEENAAQYTEALTLTEIENTAHPQATSEMWTLLAVLILLLMLTEWRWYLHEQS